MKPQIQSLVLESLNSLANAGILSADDIKQPVIENARDPQHGDYATNAAMVHAKLAKTNPRALAQQLVDALPPSDLLVSVDIAGPGFINFKLSDNAWQQIALDVLESGDDWGSSTIGEGRSVQVEFVSANPTGPLHVGHGRGAAYGAVVSNLLAKTGYKVHREYYVNDAGRQMNILATSVWLRYLELAGETLTFPSNGYKGDYIWDIAATLHRDNENLFRFPSAEVYANVAADENPEQETGDKEAHIDDLIDKARHLLGEDNYRKIFDLGLNVILDDIRDDLSLFGVNYDEWYSERTLVESGAVEKIVQQLQQSEHIYEKNGALWFRSTDFGDEKDRVVVRDNGQATYFASDIAYHLQKLERGFDKIIDVWGADHHGYVPRVKAALEAVGKNSDQLDVLLVQFAVLYRGGEKMQMSTRSGQFVTLRELRKEVGSDAARFFYIMRKCEQHLDFDLDLALSKSNENPVYYVQYAHARVCSVLRQATEKSLSFTIATESSQLQELSDKHEINLLKTMARFPEMIANAATNHEPHQISHYLRELANEFHTYYNASQFLVEDDSLRNARLTLITAVRQVLKNGLDLINVSAPEAM